MKKRTALILLCAAAALILCACAQSSAVTEIVDEYKNKMEQLAPLPTNTAPAESPAATAVPRPTVSPKETPVPTAPSTAAAEADPSSSLSPTPAPVSTAVPTLVPTPTPSPVLTAAPSPTPVTTPVPTPSPAVTAAPTPPPTFTPYPESMMAPLPESIPYGTPKPTPTPTPVPVYEPNPQGITGEDIVSLAMQYLGAKYKYGGKDPETGFDCSGLVYYCYGYYGIALNRTADAQAKNGAHVELDSLEPGDILCFYNGGSWIGHVGIYIGGGSYIHAEGSATGVVLSDLDERSCKIEARRIIER